VWIKGETIKKHIEFDKEIKYAIIPLRIKPK